MAAGRQSSHRMIILDKFLTKRKKQIVFLIDKQLLNRQEIERMEKEFLQVAQLCLMKVTM